MTIGSFNDTRSLIGRLQRSPLTLTPFPSPCFKDTHFSLSNSPSLNLQPGTITRFASYGCKCGCVLKSIPLIAFSPSRCIFGPNCWLPRLTLWPATLQIVIRVFLPRFIRSLQTNDLFSFQLSRFSAFAFAFVHPSSPCLLWKSLDSSCPWSRTRSCS